MSEPRLTSEFRVKALIRLAETAFGSAMLLRRGDATSGDIALVILERGNAPLLWRRMLDADFSYRWQQMGGSASEKGEDAPDAPERLKKLISSDPDLWILEVDVPNRERFIAQIDSLA